MEQRGWAKNNSNKDGNCNSDEEQTLTEPLLCQACLCVHFKGTNSFTQNDPMKCRHYYPHDETEAQRGSDIAQDYRASKATELDFRPRKLGSKVYAQLLDYTDDHQSWSPGLGGRERR